LVSIAPITLQGKTIDNDGKYLDFLTYPKAVPHIDLKEVPHIEPVAHVREELMKGK
jgi:hypothetical protein